MSHRESYGRSDRSYDQRDRNGRSDRSYDQRDRNQGYSNHSNGYNSRDGGQRNSFGGRGDSNRSEGRGGQGFGGNGRRSQPGAELVAVDWSTVKLSELKKDIYTESSIVTNRSQHEVDSWLTENQVTLKGTKVLRAVFEFDEASYPKSITNLLYKNYQKPTTIQSISWPVGLSGLDMISIAKTGSGKTLGFLLPAIMHTLSQPKRKRGEGPSVLIMLPTRELAQQVQEVAKEYCAAMNLSFTCLYGGSSKGPQARDLEDGIDICVATPGRLLDFMQYGTTTMSRCSFLVLDEADRMLDMGFEPQIRKIVEQIRPDRQTLMFSATWPKDVRELAQDFQTDPVFLNVGSLELAANHNIVQIVDVIEESDKEKRLGELLEQVSKDKEAKIIIFAETKRKVDELTRGLRKDGWPALCIHGDKAQSERNWVLGEFKSGKVPILLATDVAARGLDIDDIKVVINYDYSNNSEDYVHRIGRTGRRNKTGTAYTFFSSQNGSTKALELIKVLEEAKQNVSKELRSLAASAPSGNKYGRGYGYGKRQSNPGVGGTSKRIKFDDDSH